MSLEQLTQSLYQAFDAQDYAACAELLSPIKLKLVQHQLLVPVTTSATAADKLNDLRIAKKILEIGAFVAVNTSQFAQFENYFAQLKPFYANQQVTDLQQDHYATQVYALYLLYLLLQSEFLRFHTELETIYSLWTLEQVAHDTFLQFPILLEKNLMEGNYLQIWSQYETLGGQKLPLAEFGRFQDILIDLLRFEIASNITKLYTLLPIVNIKALLHVQSFSALEIDSLLAEHGWVADNGVVHFASEEHSEARDLLQVVKNVLGYARDIETIV